MNEEESKITTIAIYQLDRTKFDELKLKYQLKEKEFKNMDNADFMKVLLINFETKGGI